MLRPQVLEVEGHTCFQFQDKEVLCMTEDNLNQPQIVTDSDLPDPVNRVTVMAPQIEHPLLKDATDA